MSDAMKLAAAAAAALLAGAPKDQLAAKMLDAAICLSVEAIGLVPTIDGLLAVLALLAEEFPQEFGVVKFLHTTDRQSWPQA